MATRQQRTLAGKTAAHEKWAKVEDRTRATAAARRGLEARFEREADPEGKLLPAERAKRVESVRKAYYARLALAALKARQARQAS